MHFTFEAKGTVVDPRSIPAPVTVTSCPNDDVWRSARPPLKDPKQQHTNTHTATTNVDLCVWAIYTGSIPLPFQSSTLTSKENVKLKESRCLYSNRGYCGSWRSRSKPKSSAHHHFSPVTSITKGPQRHLSSIERNRNQFYCISSTTGFSFRKI